MDGRDCRSSRIDAVRAAGLLAAILLPAGATQAAETAGQSLCALLKDLIPQVRTYRPEGARAQLVMALAEKYEPEQLRPLWRQIDQETMATCPKDREVMLGIVNTKSLADALR